MGLIILENPYKKIELFNPVEREDKHFFTRFNYCGYIKQITDIRTNAPAFSMPAQKFHPFHGEGFPDEFEIPLLYDEAKMGDYFIKIGVGIQKKKEDVPYTNWDMHEIIRRADTEVLQGENSVSFMQRLGLNNTKYEYTKRITLSDENFIIDHTLKNTGDTTWKTLWYSHAFIPLKRFHNDVNLSISKDYKLRKASQNISMRNKKIMIPINNSTKEGECFHWDIAENASNRQVLVNEHNQEVYVAEADYRFHELQVYINDLIISVEPKIIIKLKPGEMQSWSTIYKV